MALTGFWNKSQSIIKENLHWLGFWFGQKKEDFITHRVSTKVYCDNFTWRAVTGTVNVWTFLLIFILLFIAVQLTGAVPVRPTLNVGSWWWSHWNGIWICDFNSSGSMNVSVQCTVYSVQCTVYLHCVYESERGEREMRVKGREEKS